MPGQWEFQIGPVGPLEVGDQVHLARYLLHRLGEDFNIVATFNPKPMKGDWNGEHLILDSVLISFTVPKRFCISISSVGRTFLN